MSSSRMNTYVPLIQRLVAQVISYHTAIAGQLGLNASDLKALQLLGDKSMTAGELGVNVGLTGAAVTALVDRLERSGFAIRERGTGDRRRVTVHAIPEKLREVESLYAMHHVRMSKLLSKYSANEFRAITNFLKQATETLAVGVAELHTKVKS